MSSRTGDRVLGPALVLVAWAVSGCAGGAGGPATLSGWRPPAGQRCVPVPSPDAMPDVADVVDADAVAAEVAGLDEGYVVLDIRRDSLGAWHGVEVAEGDLPPEQQDRVHDAVWSNLVPGPHERLALELRVDLEDPARTRIAPYLACPPAVRNPDDVVAIMQQVGRQVGVPGRVVLLMYVEEDGSVGDVRVARSSGVAALDEAMVHAAAFLRLHPAYNRRRPVGVWLEMPFEVIVGR